MTGKDHIISNICTITVVTTEFLYINQHISECPKYVNTITDFIKLHFTTSVVPFFISIPICMILFIVGSILPDIDNPKSILGRFVHLPFKHRTWTHTMWIVILLAIVAYFVPMINWLMLGFLLHLLWDNLSVGGVCFFYPISKYRYYGKAMVKKNHILKVYRVGQASEYILIGILIAVTGFMIKYGFDRQVYQIWIQSMIV